jgi:hypothetical protein
MKRAGLLLTIALLLPGCRLFEPSTMFAIRMELGLSEMDKPKNWDQVKELGLRDAPSEGDRAPDFSFRFIDGQQDLTRSTWQGDRPLVLIFGSYT